SPGMMRMRKNASMVSPMKVGTAKLNRVSAKRYMAKVHGKGSWHSAGAERGTLEAAASRLDVDPVEGMPAKRAEFEVHHFLAHRLQLNRMGDREPRRLFFEDDLRFPVELGALGLVADGFRFRHQFLKRLVTELCDIGSVGPRRIASKQRVQEVV